MKRYLLLVFLLCGCTSPRHDVPTVSTFGVRAAVDSASYATQSAAHRTAAANASLRVAEAKSRELLTVASAAERPLAEELHTALEQSQTAMDGVQEQLKTAQGALADSSTQAETLQTQISAQETALAQARETAAGMQTARDFWRAAAWKLALLSLALGVWTLRKPLLAFCGL
jgi:chromosome segregation ATPase